MRLVCFIFILILSCSLISCDGGFESLRNGRGADPLGELDHVNFIEAGEIVFSCREKAGFVYEVGTGNMELTLAPGCLTYNFSELSNPRAPVMTITDGTYNVYCSIPEVEYQVSTQIYFFRFSSSCFSRRIFTNGFEDNN